jgi:hypothetical protein
MGKGKSSGNVGGWLEAKDNFDRELRGDRDTHGGFGNGI